MKKIITSTLSFIISVTGFSQTIWIANNNAGAVPGTNVLTGATSLADAITAAVNGDIIYVIPSGTRHPATNITKSVSIFGGGFNPDKPTSVTSRSLNLTIQVNNVRISGMVVEGMLQINNVTGIMIDKSRVYRFNFLIGAGNAIIQNCIFGESTGVNYSLQSDLANTNLRISNNIIYGNIDGWFFRVNNTIIENNVFIGLTGSPALNVFRDGQSCSIKNNIFFGVQPRAFDAPNFLNNTQDFNLSFGATDNTYSTANGNTSSNNIVGSDPLFVSQPTVTGGPVHSFSYDAHLQATSPAKGTGLGGIDMGIYGGATPFDPFGTSLPIVQTITPPGTVYQGSNMNVRVQAKGN